MPADWEHEVNYRTRLRRESGLTPYRELIVWRRRFFAALAYAVLASGLLLIVLLARS